MAKLSLWLYEKLYKRKAPDYIARYSLWDLIMKPIRKWLANTVAANSPFNGLRIAIYRLCGFRIGKKVFIGMRCYLDDHCREMLWIGDAAVISYGVYFACHGPKQGHTPIVVEDGAYIGMRASLISGKKGITIGKNAVVGACSLVLEDVPANATAAGVPCHVIRSFEENNDH